VQYGTCIDFVNFYIFICSFISESNKAILEAVLTEVSAQFHGVDKTPCSRLAIDGTV
jgi:hypothetical protein